MTQPGHAFPLSPERRLTPEIPLYAVPVARYEYISPIMGGMVIEILQKNLLLYILMEAKITMTYDDSLARARAGSTSEEIFRSKRTLVEYYRECTSTYPQTKYENLLYKVENALGCDSVSDEIKSGQKDAGPPRAAPHPPPSPGAGWLRALSGKPDIRKGLYTQIKTRYNVTSSSSSSSLNLQPVAMTKRDKSRYTEGSRNSIMTAVCGKLLGAESDNVPGMRQKPGAIGRRLRR
ncbi:hypothetical protein EVAR_29294_1 [Eumeta japonica]|uniref:Uncharacterized protein n=1 Tax=Eumeta variegata TaxID=151549 RepID=A0A4C1VUR8_EUMVA|nr:hypothetical protein EVAR_29294_1 [Eumeta japonica]